MEARAKPFGHPIPQMLIVFPLGLLGMSLCFDLIGSATNRPGLLQASFYMIAAGVLAGPAAAVFRLLDFLVAGYKDKLFDDGRRIFDSRPVTPWWITTPAISESVLPKRRSTT